VKNKSYVLIEGTYNHDNTFTMFVCDTKKPLQLICKKDGFKYNKNQDKYLKDDELLWREIEVVDKIE